MGYLTPGITFSDSGSGAAVNAARLAQLVASAVILPTFISGMADASSSVVDGDRLPIFQLSSGEFRSITTASLVAKATAGALAVQPISIGSATPGAAFQDTGHAWIKNTGNFATSGVRLWDATSSKFRRIYNVPLNTVVAYVGGGTFDGTGLGSGNFDGWAQCNGNNGTTAITSMTTGLSYMQFIGYTS